jgi:hypothetical protein
MPVAREALFDRITETYTICADLEAVLLMVHQQVPNREAFDHARHRAVTDAEFVGDCASALARYGDRQKRLRPNRDVGQVVASPPAASARGPGSHWFATGRAGGCTTSAAYRQTYYSTRIGVVSKGWSRECGPVLRYLQGKRVLVPRLAGYL